MPTGFHVANGQIIGPNGQPWVGAGINSGQGMDLAQWMAEMAPDATCGPLFAAYGPGIRFIRLNAAGGQNYQPASYYAQFVERVTAHEIVVLIEDHLAGQNPDPLLSATQLEQALAWYADLGRTFAANPYVWAGSENEPGVDPASQQLQSYQAFRGTGNASIFVVELVGGGVPFAGGAGNPQGIDPSGAPLQMTNAIIDQHYYSDGASGEAGEFAGITAAIAQAQQVRSLDGVMPVMIGEWGPSSSGSGQDADGMNVGPAVQQTDLPWCAWADQPGGSGDDLRNPDGSMTAYGAQVVALIAARAAATSGATPMPAAVTPSPNNTVISAGANWAITDAAGNKWTITSGGQVAVNGVADTSTAQVVDMALVDGAIWQQNAAGLWWSWVGGVWTPPEGTKTSPLPAAVPPAPTPPPPAPNPAIVTIEGQITAAQAQLSAAVTALTAANLGLAAAKANLAKLT
jgi:Cellulase (glycosyl hydrolase family 5)